MDNWNEIRTVYRLAKLGTLSATAQDMGVHRSTVMRHVDGLEEALGVVLFQRNDKGYIPTEAGLEVMRLGEVTDSHFSQLESVLQSKEHTLVGKLTITLVSEIAAMIMPVVKQYQQQNPQMSVELMGDIRNFKLEYGEADIAIRGGDQPSTPDNVVMPLLQTELVLCAHKDYIKEFGIPSDDLTQHRFVALNERPKHLPWNEWIYDHIEPAQIVVKASSQALITHAILSACGIGALPQQVVDEHTDLVEIPLDEVWKISLWILVHRDMYSMPKVKAFIALLKKATLWPLQLR